MADARALLRAHRAANRIEHPYAAYSDAGKLLCKLCHENIKSETLWDGHLRSAGHRDKHATLQPPPQQQQQPPPQSQPPPGPATNHKRKLDDAAAEDEEMGDDAPAAADDSVRKKRSRTDMVAAPAAATAGISIQMAGEKPAGAAAGGSGGGRTTTPPVLSRQPSGTPAHGVELAIPSRPATPSLGEGSQSPTPRLANAHVRSPLATSGSESASTPRAPAATVETRIAAAARGATPPPLPADGRPPAARTVDEAEWAAFEAEIADAAEATPPPPSAVPQPGSGAATAALFSGPGAIAAPALTAEQVAAKSADEEHERRKLLSDAQLADEREDATRALEDEFAEMEELESRVRRLKARREALRLAHQRAATDGNAGAAAPADGKEATTTTATTTTGGAVADKENRGAAARAEGESDDDDDEDEDEDWDDGFRFRA